MKSPIDCIAAESSTVVLPIQLPANALTVQIKNDNHFIVSAGDSAKLVTIGNAGLASLETAIKNVAANANSGILLIKADDRQSYQALITVLSAASSITSRPVLIATPARSVRLTFPPEDKIHPETKLTLVISKSGAFNASTHSIYSGKSSSTPEWLTQSALREKLALLRKQEGSLFAQLLVDKDAPVSAFADAISALQSNGIQRYVFVMNSGGASVAKSDDLAAAKLRIVDLETSQKQLFEQANDAKTSRK